MDDLDRSSVAPEHVLCVGTWNVDHWKRTVAQRERAWSKLHEWNLDVALLQETVPPSSLPRDRVVYRPIGNTRPWGSAVVALGPDIAVHEIDAVRTRYSSRLFSMLGTYPGAVIVARAAIPEFGSVTLVSVYGLIDVYAQTTMFRIVADLIPLFDSPDGEHVVLGGDFNISTAMSKEAPEYKRYEAILYAVESLGLKSLARVAADRPPPPPGCPCGDPGCTHLLTYRGGHLDYLYATPSLASRCLRLRVPTDEVVDLSDHAPILADFDLARPLQRTEWDARSFAELIADRHGAEAARILEELMAWTGRKQGELQWAGYADARLDRLPCERQHGHLKLWFQLDRADRVPFQWLFAVRDDGQVELQFQYMSGRFGEEDARQEIGEHLAQILGINPDLRLRGRPTFPVSVLADSERLNTFINLLNYIVDESLQFSGETWRADKKAARSDASDAVMVEGAPDQVADAEFE